MAANSLHPPDSVGIVAEALIDAAVDACAPILARAELPEADHQFHELVALEVAGSMAINAVLRRYMGRAWKAAGKLNKDDLNRHLMQAAVSPVVGAIIAYTDDMPDMIRATFLTAFGDTLAEGLRQRRQNDRARARAAKNARH